MKKIEFNRFADFYLQNEQYSDALVSEVLKSGKYIRDKNVSNLEENLSKLCNRKYTLTTASCTDAIFFALKAAGIKEGDEVILPAFSYIASLSPILMCGAVPVFADINPETLVLDIKNIESLINKKTKAIIFVQLFGNLINLEKLQKICHDSDIILIEDAAQGLGSSCIELKGASQGDISCISFDPTKIVSAYGTGGAVLTNNEKYYKKLQMLIHHGRNDNGEFESLGYNSKIPEITAALINLQLSQLDQTIAKTNNIAKRYISKLAHLTDIKLLSPNSEGISTYHKFVILAEKRVELKQYLTNHGVETRIHYSPLLHEQKLLKDYKYLVHDLSISKSIKNKVLSLPIYPGLKNDEIDYICDCIQKFYML
ncbi:MAG: DegT/DnrJ/EryC1/StrS family aminotransferase [Bacteroidales bacterium]|nr:DegT/DnrJ/EryC1/StrS family aminotransferase [Bacteroidales bacterium]